MSDGAPSSRILAARYRLGRQIGQGAHSTVYLAEDLGRAGEQIALKITHSAREGFAFFEQAARILHWFRHPNWAEVLDAGIVPASSDGDAAKGSESWFQAQRYVEGRSLDLLEGPQDPGFVCRFLEDGARVLQAIHDLGLIHYDVTPSNCLVEQLPDGPRFTLTDGALAHAGPVEGVARGTPMYMAPEVTEEGEHDHRCDLYSLGLIAFRLITGRDAFPLDSGGPADVLRRRREELPPRPSSIRTGIPRGLEDLLLSLLSRDPNARPADGRAILRRLSDILDREIPEILPAEAFARVESGPMVGQEAALDRFRRACQSLRAAITSGGTSTRPPRDVVLLAVGPTSSGTTRLLREAGQLGRQLDVPVLSLSGRQPWATPREPIVALSSCLAALNGDTLRSQGTPDSTVYDSDWTCDRDTEDFVNLALSAARKTSYLLLIEDYIDLPQNAQATISALSRELLSRQQSSLSDDLPPIALAVDLGSATPDALLIPDAIHPECALVSVASLNPVALSALLISKFHNITLDAPDLHQVHNLTQGRPGLVLRILTLAVARGDMRKADGAWHLDTASLSTYPLLQPPTPDIAAALAAAAPDIHDLITYLLLSPEGLPLSILPRLGLSAATGSTPGNALCAVRNRSGVLVLDFATPHVRSAATRSLPLSNATQRRETLLHALVNTSSSVHAPQCAELALILNRTAYAIGVLRHATATPSSAQRSRLLVLFSAAVARSPALLDDPRAREVITSLLTRDSESRILAHMLAQAVPHDGTELPLVLRIAPTLEATDQAKAALAFLSSHPVGPTSSPRLRAEHHALCARLALDQRLPHQAAGFLRQLRDLRRSAEVTQADAQRIVAYYAPLLARNRFRQQKPRQAIACLNAALVAARGSHDHPLRAQVLNNLGISHVQLRQFPRALRLFERSVRVKRILGDIRGVISTQFNISRLCLQQGALLRSVLLAADCAARAQRHGFRDTLLKALRELADGYDRQYRSDLALITYQRAWRVATSARDTATAAAVAWRLAPLASAMGDLSVCSALLRTTLLAARSTPRLRQESTPDRYALAMHYVTASLVALHQGSAARFQVTIRRASRVSQSLAAAEQAVLVHLQAIADLPTGTSLSSSRLIARLRTAQRHVGSVPASRLALGRAHARLLRRALTARRDPPTYHPPRRLRIPLPAGPAGRLASEFLLKSETLGPSRYDLDILRSIESFARASGLVLLRSRAQAVMVQTQLATTPRCAPLFSDSIAALDGTSTPAYRCLLSLPDDVLQAARIIASVHGCPVSATPTITDLHAIAHRSMRRPGVGAAPDQRLALALRRVLDASAALRAGGSVHDLLSNLTNHMIEISGADRACVVLVDDDATLAIAARSWAGSSSATFGVGDLSSTVIGKVIRTREAVRLAPMPDDAFMERAQGLTDKELARARSIMLLHQSILCVPMARNAVLYGALYVDANRALAFDSVDMEVLSLFADQAAAAIESRTLLEQTQQSYTDLKSVQDQLVRGERLRVIGELSSGVAHEFNNLLTSILARVDTTLSTDLPTGVRMDLQLVQRAASDAAEVVRRLQSFARQQRQADFVIVDMGAVCKDAVELLRPLWRRPGPSGAGPVNVQLRLEGDLLVLGDPPALREVITNLLKNALEAVDPTGRVVISAGRRGGRILIAVKDNGVGIPRDVLPKVCDPFFTTKGDRGTGLGLALSQQIVERHGGRLSLHSQEGKGTTVQFTLPTASGPRPTLSLTNDAGTVDQVTERVLVVDDDDSVRDAVAAYLKRRGFTVDLATSAREGLAKLSDATYDIVLSDVGMPGMDGLEFCRVASARYPHLPFALMSGYASDLDENRARAVGALTVLAKPFPMDTLVRALRRAITQAKSAKG